MKYYYANSYGDEGIIESENLVDAIYQAWNFEANLYNENGELLFAPWESNEFNSEILGKFGLRVIDTKMFRCLQNIETGEIYKAPWEGE